MKKALITGVTGQDGAYLARFLLEKGYEVYGTYRRLSTPNFWRLQYLGIFDQIKLVPVELVDMGSLSEALKLSEADEVYHLAAQSFVGASFDQPTGTGDVTGLGVTRLLEAIRQVNPEIRLYQASTSELYGDGNSRPLSEKDIFQPSSPYAAAKLYGFWMCHIYRKGYGIFASNGILFNHESPLRGLEFVTRKITNSVAKIAQGIEKKLVLGNLESKRDWGYAPDYVESMWNILQHEIADDYVIATNESHTVREFVELAFDKVGLNWEEHVTTDKRYRRPIDVNFLQGNYSKAEKTISWKPKVKFQELVGIMVEEDMKRWERYLNGEHFPWDASNYPSEENILSRAMKV